MALASGIYANLLVEMGTNALAYSLNADDAIDLDLLSDSHTPDFDADDEYADLDNIVTGTGWAGALNLSSPTYTGGTDYVTFDAADVSESTTTLTDVEGCALWDDTLTGDPLLCCVDFGTTYATVAGTMAITWSASGIWRLKHDPSA